MANLFAWSSVRLMAFCKESGDGHRIIVVVLLAGRAYLAV